MELEPPRAVFFAWSRSRPNLVGGGAGVGSGTSDSRSQSRLKKWRLRNTAFFTVPNMDVCVTFQYNNSRLRTGAEYRIPIHTYGTFTPIFSISVNCVADAPTLLLLKVNKIIRGVFNIKFGCLCILLLGEKVA